MPICSAVGGWVGRSGIGYGRKVVTWLLFPPATPSTSCCDIPPLAMTSCLDLNLNLLPQYPTLTTVFPRPPRHLTTRCNIPPLTLTSTSCHDILPPTLTSTSRDDLHL